MKVEEKIELSVSSKQVWELISNFKGYGDWNSHLKNVDGKFEIDEVLDIRFHVMGSQKNEKAIITGLKEPKYFSFSTASNLGAWWLTKEYVIRLEEPSKKETEAQDNKGMDRIFVYLELYCHGLRMRLGKNKLKSLFAKNLSQLAWSLKAKFPEG